MNGNSSEGLAAQEFQRKPVCFKAGQREVRKSYCVSPIGVGYSGLSVHDRRVFAVDGRKQENAEFLVCIDTDDGAEILAHKGRYLFREFIW